MSNIKKILPNLIDSGDLTIVGDFEVSGTIFQSGSVFEGGGTQDLTASGFITTGDTGNFADTSSLESFSQGLKVLDNFRKI